VLFPHSAFTSELTIATENKFQEHAASCKKMDLL
jgi:hypothetical protein